MCQANWVIRGHRAYFMTRVFSVFSKDTHLRVVNKANWFFCLRAAEQASAATVSGVPGTVAQTHQFVPLVGQVRPIKLELQPVRDFLTERGFGE